MIAGITGPIWIGLNDLTLQHSFDWTDGSEVDYTFWNAGEPNNYGDKGEDCVEMYGNVSRWPTCGRREQTTGAQFYQILKKNVNILEFHDHIIWYHHEKCIQKSTNMPSIGLLIREIDVNKFKI